MAAARERGPDGGVLPSRLRATSAQIRGCYFNVAGLPLQRVCAELRALVTAE